MRCAKCGTENPDHARFCIQCAAQFGRRCPSCNAENPASAKFCSQCATELDIAATAPQRPREAFAVKVGSNAPDAAAAVLDGERKTVTALFADIKGSTELEQDLDPEEASAIVDPALKLMINAVNHYGGYLVQSTGDGIFAVFGAPIAYEDHARRALHAALRMQQDLRGYGGDLQKRGTAPVEIRVGVDTGEVVMRSISTREGHTEYTPIGNAVNLASRIQTLARTGTVVASESTRKLVEGYPASRS